MQAFGKSQGGTRREDIRFLTGKGQYLADILPADSLHGVFLRAPAAHARITTLDVSAARDMPGVCAIWTARDLDAAGITGSVLGVSLPDRRGGKGAAPKRPILADGIMRHIGEPVALVVAQTQAQAMDAIEAIELDFEELPVTLALEPGGPTLHPEAPDNVALDWDLGDEAATQAAFENAAHITRLTVRQNRVTAASLEPRAALAEWDGTRLHFAFNGQGVWTMKRELAKTLNLDPEQVHVTTPDVGGGFGMKVMVYPEHLALAGVARALGCAVSWVAERGESIASDNGARDLTSTAEMAFDADHRIIGYRVESRFNLGAYNSQFGQNIQTALFSKVFTGVYDIPTAHLHVQGIYTNTTPVDAYRGAGRPEAITLIERTIDMAARELGLSPFDLRARNFIRADSFPYQTPAGETYDVGDFTRLLNRAKELGDVAGFPARKAESAARGKLRGLGLSYYIEAILGDDTEGATVEFTPEGRVKLYVGTQSNGQGHETVYARYLAGLTGLDEGLIDIAQGDSDLIAKGGGTGGSRSVTVQTTATHGTVEQMVEAFSQFLEEEIGAGPVNFDDGIFSTPGSNQRLTLIEAADLARKRGATELLRHERRVKLAGRSYPNGAHLCEVEIDPETGALRLDRFLAVDDFGNLMNPALAQGQVHGGVAQGYGQAVLEEVVFDDQGQLQSGSFMDYAMPRAKDFPMISFESVPIPSTGNPLGIKGCGEAGTVGALAALSNAALDALWDSGVRSVEMPLTPQRVWSWLHQQDK
ncbi:xanthine dehydrogenase family protein molybdopterin-binding subunit [Roseinatronobacter bogoriensis]|uniref:Xanthine dehydrogenase family protein molybdopterin-binding subunit n=1 Tax=Roseinatronobacter bogoriensis subsp. barguzinensis TaxID=441209 RepID=A0A2K8K5D2_9RHOB|nr:MULTISPECIES: xanthine dehydrogenase family protein molybdopterin-binding subunit [Rhodobaca]ATX64664.1 xanthine dehydrogenase family protein molybdopterin-binding subunit [Rhodobaca barguzinensis]MBB4209496.1 carbon-monoxide dehydrogenase large subunit [Rhodobaca bogoriensis DSM 18756]TDW35138.1 carbon-monoxide dehydrogenase large subunit [Rhodobaca barguzinensis]TDY66852.1 carbon-monoxide dehydrogenase large subunit [Rhodobaca bogoriensis DSM 18756]